MQRQARHSAGFAPVAAAIGVAGLISALVDGTLGWEYLALELVARLTR